MVTAPMLSASVEVRLPQASVAPPPDAKEHLVVTIDDKRRVFVADSLVDDPSLLPKRVKERLAQTRLEHVAIRADRSVDYGTVLGVLDRLRAAGIKSVGLVMSPPDPR